jgi:hypothetical protein
MRQNRLLFCLINGKYFPIQNFIVKSKKKSLKNNKGEEKKNRKACTFDPDLKFSAAFSISTQILIVFTFYSPVSLI